MQPAARRDYLLEYCYYYITVLHRGRSQRSLLSNLTSSLHLQMTLYHNRYTVPPCVGIFVYRSLNVMVGIDQLKELTVLPIRCMAHVEISGWWACIVQHDLDPQIPQVKMTLHLYCCHGVPAFLRGPCQWHCSLILQHQRRMPPIAYVHLCYGPVTRSPCHDPSRLHIVT